MEAKTAETVVHINVIDRPGVGRIRTGAFDGSTDPTDRYAGCVQRYQPGESGAVLGRVDEERIAAGFGSRWFRRGRAARAL